MSRGGYRPGAGRRSKGATTGDSGIPKFKSKRLSPLEYALAIINDPEAAPERCDRMAIAALPYTQPRLADRPRGKKVVLRHW